MTVSAQIPNLITSSSFETVRDRLGEILAVELANQVELAKNQEVKTEESKSIVKDVPDKVFKERFRPISESEQTAITVAYQSSNLSDIQTPNVQNDEVSYYVIIMARSGSKVKYNELEIFGDQNSTFKLHRLLRMCRSIIMDERYHRLGFTTAEGNAIGLGYRRVQNIRIGHPYQESATDASNFITGFFEIKVRLTECTNPLEGVAATGIDTTAMLDGSEGYYWTINIEDNGN